ncbi:unnamed protein product, partial [Urochloa humidicola]
AASALPLCRRRVQARENPIAKKGREQIRGEEGEEGEDATDAEASAPPTLRPRCRLRHREHHVAADAARRMTLQPEHLDDDFQHRERREEPSLDMEMPPPYRDLAADAVPDYERKKADGHEDDAIDMPGLPWTTTAS